MLEHSLANKSCKKIRVLWTHCNGRRPSCEVGAISSQQQWPGTKVPGNKCLQHLSEAFRQAFPSSVCLSDLHLINCHSEVGQTERRVALLASRCDRRLAPIMPRDVCHILQFLNVTSGNVFLSCPTSFNTVLVRGLEQSNALNSYSGGVRFDSRPVHHVSWPSFPSTS